MTRTRVGFFWALRAELTKTFTLRSIQATLAAALIAPAVLALASGLAFDPTQQKQFTIQSHGFETAGFGQPLIILFAALIIGTEFRDGQLRTTLLSTPKRGRVLAAKFLVASGLGAVIGITAIGLSVLIKHAALGPYGLTPTEFTLEMGQNLLGVAVNYALIALVAAGITTIARTFVVTLVVLVPLVLGVTISLVGVIPVLKYLPDLSGIQLLMPYPGVGLLEPLPGGIVMTAWATLTGIAAFMFFRARDVRS